MRRQDREISEPETREILQKGDYGVLSMCTLHGEGYGIPLNYVLSGNELYFHSALEGNKLEALEDTCKASFCVVGKTELLPAKFSTVYESAIASGQLSTVDGEEKRSALIRLIEKYSVDYIKEGKAYIEKSFSKVHVFKLSIEHLSGKARKQ